MEICDISLPIPPVKQDHPSFIRLTAILSSAKRVATRLVQTTGLELEPELLTYNNPQLELKQELLGKPSVS